MWLPLDPLREGDQGPPEEVPRQDPDLQPHVLPQGGQARLWQ